jgi:hypothetical protein
VSVARFIASATGTYKALLEEHIPIGFVFDESASLAKLRRYSVVLLPDAAFLDEQDIGLLREYVGLGGGLIAWVTLVH